MGEGECLQVRLSKCPAALHHPRAGRSVTVVGQFHQAGHEAVVRQLILTIKGVWGMKRRLIKNMWVGSFYDFHPSQALACQCFSINNRQNDIVQ